MNIDSDPSLAAERRKFGELGIAPDRLSEYQILCLPQNIFSFAKPDDLYDADGTRNLAKLLKSADLRCATALDLGIEIPILHMRSSEMWLGVLWILDYAVVPLIVQVLAPLISAKLDALIHPRPKVHADLYVENGANTIKLSYSGDGQTLVRVLKSLEPQKRNDVVD
jgi:hypothetical protein